MLKTKRCSAISKSPFLLIWISNSRPTSTVLSSCLDHLLLISTESAFDRDCRSANKNAQSDGSPCGGNGEYPD
jgi:hypothetical protein